MLLEDACIDHESGLSIQDWHYLAGDLTADKHKTTGGNIRTSPNGCGKTSLTSYARNNFQQFPVLDPDAVAKSLQETIGGGVSDIEGGKKVLRQAEKFIQSRTSFTVETTLSGSTYLKMALRASDWQAEQRP